MKRKRLKRRNKKEMNAETKLGDIEFAVLTAVTFKSSVLRYHVV
jgi:hypothetical protein